MKKATLALAFMGLLVGAAPAHAGSVDCRERHQQRRIVQGLRSGELTWREAARLSAQEARVRAELQRDLNRMSRHIYRQRHDRQGRL